MNRLALFTSAFVASALLAHADVLTAEQPGASRLTIDIGAGSRPMLHQHGNHLEISSGPDVDLATPETVPHNVVSFAGGRGHADLQVLPGARVKTTVSGTALTVEISDPTSRPHSRTANQASHRNPAWNPPPQAAAIPAPPPASPVPAPPAAPSVSAVPAPVPAGPVPDVAAVPPPAPAEPILFQVQAPADVGAVAFRRGDRGMVVFDAPIDPAHLTTLTSRPVIVDQVAAATLLSLELGPDETLAVTHTDEGWQVSQAHPDLAPIKQTATASTLTLEFDKPGRVLTVSDPLTGQTILLGTVREAGKPAPAVLDRRTAPGFTLLPSWLGVAVAVTADAVDLTPLSGGFVLHTPDPAFPDVVTAATPQNGLDIPQDSTEILRRRLLAEVAGAAAAQPRARTHDRLAAARTMLALGMASEAQALLKLIANDDPKGAREPVVSELAGIAAVLAGRPDEASGLDNPALTDSAELDLWRNLRDQARGNSAPRLGNGWPLVAGYSESIRNRIGPVVAEAAVRAGETIPAELIAGPDYAFVRAVQLAQSGNVDAALEAFDKVAGSRDERDSVRATMAALELRLARNQVTVAQAADLVEKLTARWRGDREELTLRLRAADLRAQAGQPRKALADLDQTKTLFPEQSQAVEARQTAILQSVLTSAAGSASSLELVTLASDYAGHLPSGVDGERMAALLADKLVALDLPARARPVLEQLMARATSPASRATYGLRLAQVTLDGGDPAKARQLLQSLEPADLTPEGLEQRAMLLARASADLGDVDGAAELLGHTETPSAELVRADYLAKTGNWQGSLQLLTTLMDATLPPTGDLTEAQQALVLKAATAAVQAGDRQAIDKLRAFQPRLRAPRADLFRLLTQEPVGSARDLPRSARELTLARTLSGEVNAATTR